MSGKRTKNNDRGEPMSEYNDDLKIDFDNLDKNWRDHATNYMKWAENWANAVAEKDRKKEEIDVLKADLDAHYREKLEKDIGKKPTETMVASAIIADEKFKVAQQELITMVKNVNVLASAKTAFEHRKKALEGSTNLWINGYWAEPRVSAEAKEKFKGDGKVVEKQREALQKNPRLQKRKPTKKK